MPWHMYGGQLLLSFQHVNLAHGTWLGCQAWREVRSVTEPNALPQVCPFLNPILQLADPQEIFVKACTII